MTHFLRLMLSEPSMVKSLTCWMVARIASKASHFLLWATWGPRDFYLVNYLFVCVFSPVCSRMHLRHLSQREGTKNDISKCNYEDQVQMRAEDIKYWPGNGGIGPTCLFKEATTELLSSLEGMVPHLCLENQWPQSIRPSVRLPSMERCPCSGLTPWSWPWWKTVPLYVPSGSQHPSSH